MKTTEKTTATRNPATVENPATVNAFATLLQDFASAYNNRKDKNDPAFVKSLQDLATACAYSVLKKCILASANPTLISTRRDLARGLHDRDRADYCADNATETEYNDNGDPQVVTIDRDLADGLKKLTAENLGIGVDLVSVATVAILDETRKQADRDPDLPCDLERPYTVKTLSKRVYIQTATSCAWKEVETLPIKEIYKAIRRYIMETASERSDPRAKYCYLEDLAVDESGNETADRIYIRLGKYSDLGGYVKDFNGKETFIVADNETAKEAADLVSKMNLTARQAQILKYRRQGLGYRAIATALGIRPESVYSCIKSIQMKALAIGLDSNK